MSDIRKTAKKYLFSLANQHNLQTNFIFLRELKGKIRSHPLNQNPARSSMSNSAYSLEKMRKIHLEYRHAIVQSFTGALSAAVYQCYTLEEQGILPSGGKAIDRRFKRDAYGENLVEAIVTVFYMIEINCNSVISPDLVGGD